MSLKKIRFYNYRNIIDREIETDSSIVYLIGENAQGKTNFIEAIYFLCYGASFRTKIDKQVIRLGEKNSSIKGIFFDNDQEIREISVKINENKKKEIKLDSVTIKDRKKLVEINPCIIFAHDDISFINGPPERRRWFINQTLSLFNPDFIDLLREYRKIIKNRNISLKTRNYDLIDVYNHEYIKRGIEIQKRRKEIFNKIGSIVNRLYKEIAGVRDELRIEYKSSWRGDGNRDEIKKELRKNLSRELEMGMTLKGPHRDRILFFFNDENFTNIASIGQLRIASLILRMTQAIFFHKMTKKKPILLLDDVLLELDSIRRRNFFLNLPDYDQVFFTFLNNEKDYSLYGNKLIYLIENGEVNPWKKQKIF